MSFWDSLLQKGPIAGLSPMDGVTDAAMRYMTAKHGKPDVIFTEFVSVDALKHAKNEESVDRLMLAFLRVKDVGPLTEPPYEVAQVFGHEPELFYQAAVIVATLGYDGMDINMGCPAKNVSENGSGAGLIRTPEIAKDLVKTAKKGIEDWCEGRVTIDDLQISEAVKNWINRHKPGNLVKTKIPVSVKTRLGVDRIIVEEWMETIMETKPAMITVHGRTLKQLYQGQADWEAIGRAAGTVHRLGGYLLGNGDVQSMPDGRAKMKEYGTDGFLIGRAAEGNPGIFSGTEPSWEQRKSWMEEHAALYERIFGSSHFVPMRKHLAWYCKGFPGASEVRGKLVRTNKVSELIDILD